jgi:prolycopene isomerase
VVSCCDARQTFLKLIGRRISGNDLISKIKNMTPSLSMFVLYLGMDDNFKKVFKQGVNLWFLSDYDLDKVYNSAKRADFNRLSRYLIHISPDRKSVLAYMNTPYKNNTYWDSNKRHISEAFIEKIEKEAIPGISDHIVYQGAATPKTLKRYTLNYKGAAYGWAPIPEQLADLDFKKPSFIRGLYLAGHWSTLGLGIPGVSYIAYNIANLIMKKYKS